MDKLELKRQLLDACLKIQKGAAEVAFAEMNEANQSANDYGNPEDWFDTFKSDMLNKRDMYSKQLKKVLDDIKLLEKIDSRKELDKVAFGAVVHTNTQKLFVAIGLGKVTAGNETYFAISPSVPIFLSLRDKKKGDAFDFRGVKGTVVDVF